MEILSNSRQMPSSTTYTREKDYCDLLYAWVQVNSERIVNSNQRRIEVSKVKWTKIEQDFTRKNLDGKVEKVMSRKTIAKYFNAMVEKGLFELSDDEKYYNIKVLGRDEANLIEYNTLSKLMNVMQRNSISIYNYLFNCYYANGKNAYIVTIKNIKNFIGIATSTTSNNLIVDDTLEILKRLGLLDYAVNFDSKECKSYIEIQWVRNKLPEFK